MVGSVWTADKSVGRSRDVRWWNQPRNNELLGCSLVFYLTFLETHTQVANGTQNWVIISPRRTLLLLFCVLGLFVSVLLSGWHSSTDFPLVVIGKGPTWLLFLVLRFMTVRRRAAKSVTTAPPKKLPTARPTELLEPLELLHMFPSQSCSKKS